MITFTWIDKDSVKKICQQTKSERIFPAIQILLSEGPGSRLYLAPREVHPDSRIANFCTAAKSTSPCATLTTNTWMTSLIPLPLAAPFATKMCGLPSSHIFMFRNVRLMTVEDLDRFDPTDPLTSNDEELDGSSIESSQIKQRKVRAANSYFYKIGEYASSTYYRKFLSDKLVRTPSGRRITVQHTTDRISRMPKSTFRAWFRMPLFKVVEIADRFIAEGWLGLSHHCRQLERLQMKAELLVMGTLAMIGGTIQSFRQLKTLTHISATEHSKFFLTFVEKIVSI